MTEQLDLKSTRIYENTMGDILCAFAHLGEEVYLSDDKSFNTFTKGKLIGVSYIICGVDYNAHNPWTKYPFVGKSVEDDGLEKSAHYKYFILAEYAKFKEKKLRPFVSIQEFIERTECEIGNLITFKRKDHSTEYNMLFAGYALTEDGEVLIYLGAKYYVLGELMNNFLYYRDGEWLPFGIEE